MDLFKSKLQADYKRIIHATLNLDRPHEPRLKKQYELEKAWTTDNFNARVPLFKPTPDDFAQVHKAISHMVAHNVREFLNQQHRIDDKRTKYRKVSQCYSQGDYINGVIKTQKDFGLQVAKVIRDANQPPEDVEQDRKMIDYTLRACEYLKKIENMARPDVIRRLEPNLIYINEQFREGEWCKVHWYELGMDTEIVDKLNYLSQLHRVHVSLKSPLQIAHYPTLRHLRERREVITKLGKYLTTFKDFIGLDDTSVKNYVEKYNAIIASRTGWRVNFIESNDPDGFVKIYNIANARSCMHGMDAVRVYAHDKSVIRLAYLENTAKEILARCIVREDLKQYVRVYPDPNGSNEGRHLLDYLKANGYTHGDLYGCLLQAIEHHDDDCDVEGIYVAPYIDAGSKGNGGDESAQSGSIVEIDGKEYIEINSNGDLCLTMTNGYTDDIEDDEDYSNCDHCGDRVHNDDTYYTWHDEYICSHCEDNHYTHAFVERNREELVHNDRIIWVGDVAYHEDVEFSDFDIYYCEASDQWCHADDLVYTSMGDIHYDYAQRLDHADDEGNEFAHHDDAHQLSDGSWCHRKNADELQEEIDEADKEDEEEETTQNESGYYFGKNLTPEQKQHNHNLLDQAEKDILKNENN